MSKLNLRLSKKIVAVILVLIVVIVFALIKAASSKTPQEAQNTQQQKFQLPADWQNIKSDNKKVVIKLEKQNQQTFKPTLVLSVVDSQVDNPKQYTDNLIAGAKSTLTKLRYTGDTASVESGVYNRVLKGYYTNSGKQIFLYQQIIIKSGKVYTLTISYLDKGLTDTELENLSNLIINEYTKN